MLMHFRRRKKFFCWYTWRGGWMFMLVHLRRRVNSYVEAVELEGDGFLCWSSWEEGRIFMLKHLGRWVIFYVDASEGWILQSTGDRAGRLTSGASELQVLGPFYLLRQQNTKCDDAPENEREENWQWPWKQKEGHKLKKGKNLLLENGLIVKLSIQVAWYPKYLKDILFQLQTEWVPHRQQLHIRNHNQAWLTDAVSFDSVPSEFGQCLAFSPNNFLIGV